MNKLYTCGIAAAFGFLSLAVAQEQQPPPESPTSTSQAEGTAADRTPPGKTPTQGAPRQAEDPRPSTSPTEGTAADTTPPGKTQTGAGSQTGAASQRSDITGASVVTPADAPLGKVVDVVFDSKNQPAFVVISSEGKAVAMPYSVASSMKTEDKIVVDRSRLQAAPKIKEGEWRNQSSSTWKSEATRYWDQG